MKIGILTGGGDAPGLNAVIRGVVVRASQGNHEVIGLEMGWKGVLEKLTHPLSLAEVEDIHREGGTILGSSRTNLFKIENGPEKAFQSMKELGLDALVAVGGEDTLGVAKKLFDMGAKTVGVPKTIDNDLNATDYTFGFDTAINRVMEALDRLHTTAKSHHRCIVVEVMGRHAGWMTLYGGMAGGAHVIIIPEVKTTMDEICGVIEARRKAGKVYSLVAVAEGAKIAGEEITRSDKKDSFGHVILGGIAERLAKAIEEKTGIETRHAVLGHLQRGGDPSAFDRVLGTRLGVKAAELVEAGNFGKMVSLQGGNIVAVPLEAAVASLKTVPRDQYELAKLFFG